jgi:hypothetical protein
MIAPANGTADQVTAPPYVVSPPRSFPSGIHVTTGLPHFRLRLSAALALSLLAMLPALPALAQGHKTTCASRSHARHGARACAVHSRKGHVHTDRRHHAGHGVKSRRAAGTVPTGAARSMSAVCEDASAPLSAGQGSHSCAAGSEPACADGSSPAPARAGEPAPPCPASTERDTGGGETTCEDAPGNPCEAAEDESGSPCEETSPAASTGEGPSFICEG